MWGRLLLRRVEDLPRSARHPLEETDRELRLLAEQAPERRPLDPDHLERREGGHVAGARLAVEERELAEEVAGLELGLGPVALPDLHAPVHDHVERLAGIAGLHDDLPLLV